MCSRCLTALQGVLGAELLAETSMSPSFSADTLSPSLAALSMGASGNAAGPQFQGLVAVYSE